MSSPSKRLFLFALAVSKIREVSFNYFSVLVILTPNLVLLNINRTCLSALVFLLSPKWLNPSWSYPSSLELDPETRPQRERNKKRQSVMHVHHIFFSFLYISLPFLHDYDVKMPNFTFYGERKQATTKFYFSFWTWIYSPFEFNSRRIGQFLTK